ncbi:hypothetical protein DL766_007541 [Monosporascus sp. MC13-8B]|uniref:Uncharacterized protein n=1 Tax=Monosporascus cannonballus TaxID=155416 RepID=A0ABY0H5Q2_9PEZI|nr:hypothetical protein DL762_005129 [Monosporascus cannonballus]RYO91506.1 hypothetical protein DL763_004970 [Monosporascus cannonballus]RYP23222.1 hypothetical protein DL766_007541 [Monosporascus sp. MC13-8B]
MPPPRGSDNALEGPGDYYMTSVVHNDTYPAIDSSRRVVHRDWRAVRLLGDHEGDAGGAAAAEKPAPEILPLKFEVTDRAGVEAAAAEVKRVFRRIDIAVNSAAILGMTRIAEGDPEDWRKILEANVYGPYLVTRAFIPLMLEAGGLKTFLTVASVGAHLISPTLSAYQTSKLAVLRLTESINADYGDQGILAYSIHPGNIITEMAGNSDDLDPRFKVAFTETAELTGDSVVYLTSERRDWLAGRYVNVTWDLPELETKKDEIVRGDKLKVKLVF